MITGFMPGAPLGDPIHSVLAASGEALPPTPDASGLIAIAISYAGSTSTIPVYEIGNTVRIFGTFTDRITGALLLPTGLGFRLKRPDRVVDTSIVPSFRSAGVYSVDIIGNQGGVWHFTWSATGAAKDGEFVITGSLSDEE